MIQYTTSYIDMFYSILFHYIKLYYVILCDDLLYYVMLMCIIVYSV